MSLVLQSSGGGSVTIQEPTTASNFTATMPAATGTVMVSGNMPAFSAKLSADQTGLGDGVWTKVQASSEQFDTANCYDTSTYRFTPNVAGYYLLTGNIGVATAVTGQFIGAFYKNGSSYNVFFQSGDDRVNAAYAGSVILYLNGSSDYVELYAYLASSGTKTLQSEGGLKGYFTGCLLRTA
jgi:hypothetical protein